MKNLVIVESPAKAKTIEKFLGKDFKVLSSFGHIRDLKKKGISIDFENRFAPEYEIPADKKDIVKTLKKAASEAEMVWLASDEDREGEAIAWHLYEVLGLSPEKTRRIVFHEITKPAILQAIENPRGIDLDMVNAQQARRVLDRIVGFELSPVLWKKIKPALSAGRVQSVAVRLICEKEKEVREFVSEPFFRINAQFNAHGSMMKAELSRRLPDKEETLAFLKGCENATFKVVSNETHPVRRSPLPPFTTSTLQQEASRRLGFSVQMTMMVAQTLYEAGLITYMRTDSLNLSQLALRDIDKVVAEQYGKDYLKRRHFHTSSKGAQEAHEAIRPTYAANRTISLGEREQKLYDLIWRRTMATQMADAVLEKNNIDISVSGRPEVFKAEGETVLFDGFLKVYGSESSGGTGLLPHLDVGEVVPAVEIKATERFTMPPARYTEGSLVKKMEDLGIGRPSTYAPTISTIQARDYVKKGESDGVRREYLEIILDSGGLRQEEKSEMTGSDKGRLVPTDVGMIVNDFLTENFPDILDFNFTAKVEEKFDDIAEGKLPWQNEMADFYSGFHPEIEKINSMRMEHKVGERLLGTDPASGKPVYVKIGRFGPVVQIGDASDEEKPLFASLQSDQSVSSITFEEAMKLFELPREIGEFEGVPMIAGSGRFGPYIRHKGGFVSIPSEMSPLSITREDAISLIEAKREAEAKKFIKEFEEIPGLQVLNGRFGPYMAYKPAGAKKAVNYKIPKGTDPASLTAADARALMEKQDNASKKGKGKK